MQEHVKRELLKCRQVLHLVDEDLTLKYCSYCKNAAALQPIYGQDKRAIYAVRCCLTVNWWFSHCYNGIVT